MRFWERYFGGHISIGPVTVYGENAMHWGVTISIWRRGYFCFRLPLRCMGQWWPMYCYHSPTATPGKATWWLFGKSRS